MQSGYVIRPYTQAEYQAHHRKVLQQCFIGLIISGVIFALGLWLTKRSVELSWTSQWGHISWVIGVSMLFSSAPFVILFFSAIGWRTKHYLNTKAWVISWHDQIVGSLELSPKAGAYVLTNILINPKYRRQGLGRALIQQAAQDAQQKIYVRCTEGLIPFYTRCGFVRFSKTQAPKALRRYMFVLSHPMS